MPTCNNLDQSRTHHLKKKKHILNIIKQSCIPHKKKQQQQQQTNKLLMIRNLQCRRGQCQQAGTKRHFSLFAL